MNNGDFTILISGGSRRCWVSICIGWLLHSKWLNKWSKESSSNFVLSLNILPQKLFRWFRRPQLRATGDWQLHHNNTCAHASHLVQFLAQHQIIQMTQASYSPDLAPWDFWLFLKLKSPLKGKRFQTVNETQENTMGQLMVIGKTVWGPKMPTLKGTEVSLSYVQCFLYLISFWINVSIFHSVWLDTFWTGLIYLAKQEHKFKQALVSALKGMGENGMNRFVAAYMLCRLLVWPCTEGYVSAPLVV